ncbi:glycoside hydrolase family 1 protein [Nakamurella endophytica]|uniref:Beta-glucosidase n=1 Tax=Nakamurella endophytica TaxID=1748367 RepID=A0A917WMH3_9ACTN|nr:family 1 glycosylhydrolase [Nakamurella endophytica]GGM15354.1 beta-glucosidase [Nakamurella endophytica]
MADRDALVLPSGFLLGTTSAAYRVEGAADAGDRTPSIWDVVGAAPGRTADGSTGSERISHIKHADGDLALLRLLGPDAHRFSVSWSRVSPSAGRPHGDPVGVAHYDRVLDGLLAAGIEPWLCAYHWDLPVELMAAGGWLVRDTADRFADYVGLLAERFGDRVAAWITLADPWQHMVFGHAAGVDAPGLTLLGDALPVLHHQLLGHGRAVAALRAAGARRVGIAVQHAVIRAASPAHADRWAAAAFDAFLNRSVADPVLHGRLPRALETWFREVDMVKDGDLAVISAPLDFYGVDHHQPLTVAAAPGNRSVPFTLVDPAGAATDAGAAIEPAALTAALRTLARRHPGLPPIVVSDSGGSFADVAGGDGRADVAGGDGTDDRIRYLHEHLAATLAARADGVDVEGYFHRSLTDGWEGAEGYTQRYGLVAVDPDGTRRIRPAFEYLRQLLSRSRSR